MQNIDKTAKSVPDESVSEVGFVKSVREFLLFLDGLPTVKIHDLITSESGAKAYVSGLLADKVEAIRLTGEVKPGEVFRPVGEPISLPVGDFLLGRAVSPLGEVIDGKGSLTPTPKSSDRIRIIKTARGISERQFITEQFDSGLTLIDTLVPLGKGQRELVMGDARSGKTSFLLDLVVNQKYTNTLCVYTMIGKPLSEVKAILDVLSANNAFSHTVMVTSFSSDSPGLSVLCPKAALTIAEYFQQRGRDVLVILDDMGTHAKTYREISLISERFPGREAYPGDMFFEQARIMERAGRFSQQSGGGSITALPVIEVDLADYTSFIPTNLMSMTDGHILFRSSLYNQGRRPAVDLGLSVSRVGRQTQNQLASGLAAKIRQVLAQAESLATLSGFGGELPESTQQVLRQKSLLEEFLKQTPLLFIPYPLALILLGLPFSKFLADKDVVFAAGFRRILIDTFFRNKDWQAVGQEIMSYKSEKELFVKLDGLSASLESLVGAGSLAKAVQIVDPQTWLPMI